MANTTAEARVALITGAARGIGLATARRFARDGYRVCIIDVNREALQAAAAELPPEAMLREASVTDRARLLELVGEIVGRWGRLDVLVNNAAVNSPGTTTTQSRDEWARVLEVNLTGAFIATSVVATQMRSQGSGAIVNIGSIGGAGFGGSPAYAASKAGLVGLTKQAARELGPHGIRVNLVAPGVISTDWVARNLGEAAMDAARENSPLRRIGTPEDVAGVVAFLASEDAAHVTGQVISVSGGAWMP